MIGVRRTLAAFTVGVLLVGTAFASVWLMASAGVFTGGERALPQSPAADTISSDVVSGPIRVTDDFQVAQPRDPFEPLITSPGGGDTTPATDPGDTTTTTGGGGDTSTTAPGDTTTSTFDDTPDGVRVVLLEVRDEDGAFVAVVEVDGETFTVGVGDTFATTFKVVSLTDNGGVFTFGDNAFTLAVGQSILK